MNLVLSFDDPGRTRKSLQTDNAIP